MKIGIYSGTFDPVHEGHVAFALEAAKQCNLDKVYFLVEPRPRRKQGVKALEHRQAMVKLAISKYPNLGSIVLNHARYSVEETLPALQARFKGADIVFLMGDDMLTYFTEADWPQLKEFTDAVHLAIGLRNVTPEDVKSQIKVIEKTRGTKLSYQLFDTSFSKQNSQNARQKLRKGIRPEGLSDKVYKYIQKHRLYEPVD